MKRILFCSLLLANILVYPSTINGRFLEFSRDDTSAGIRLQISTDTGEDELGGATFVINFDTSLFSFDNPPVEDYNYIFHNFSGGNYEKGFLTKVLSNQLWINIELFNDNEGTALAGPGDWTDVLTIYFKKKAEDGNSPVEAQKNSLHWSVFQSDNKTIFSPGDFTAEGILTEKTGRPSEYQFELCQNYPNPFNPSTKINFKLKTGGKTRLVIYDLLGNEVYKIVDKELAAGNYKEEIDGSRLSSGIYIYSLNVEGKYAAVKKMILLK